jgi:hypothetical protein
MKFWHNIWRNFALSVTVFSFVTNPASAQQEWPSYWDVIEEGVPIPSHELKALLTGVSGVFEIGGYAVGVGYAFNCREHDPIIVFFDNGMNNREQVDCVFDGSRFCFGSDTEGECMDVRTVPNWGGLFLTFEHDAEALSADDIEFLQDTPAIRLGMLPIKADSLLEAKGLIDFGPVAFTLPPEPGFVLRQGSGFPLGLAFGEEAYGGFRVNTEIVGWPEYFTLPVAARTPQNADSELAQAQLVGWESAYRNRDLGGFMGSTYELARYESALLELPNGHCVRIREDIRVIKSEEAWEIKPSRTVYFRQACITPNGGAFLLITTALNDPENEDIVTVFEVTSLAILDSLRLGYVTGQ